MARHTRRKWFSDLLGPLKRWLQSQVGQPWNDVYSEACAVIKPDSPIRAHVKTHLLEFVERYTFMRDGKVCILETGYRSRGEIPVTELRYGRSRFFVHPESGLLCVIPKRPRSRRIDSSVEQRAQTSRWVNHALILRRLNGSWFACSLMPFPQKFAKGDSPWRFDSAEKKLICRSSAYDIYGKTVYCIAKRQLSRRELKRYQVHNDSSFGTQPSANRLCDWLTTAFLFFAGRRFWVIGHCRLAVRIRLRVSARIAQLRQSDSAIQIAPCPLAI